MTKFMYERHYTSSVDDVPIVDIGELAKWVNFFTEARKGSVTVITRGIEGTVARLPPIKSVPA